MPGVKITLPLSFTDTSLPLLRADPLLTHGSLLLAEPGHPANPVVGAITDGLVLPNIGWAEAAELIPGATAGSTGAVVDIQGAITTAPKGLIERSGKGGMHVIVSQATALASGDGVIWGPSSSVASYIFNNKSHSFYVSYWDRMTRPNAGSPPSSSYTVPWGVLQSATTMMCTFRESSLGVPSGATPLGFRPTPISAVQNSVGPRYGNVALPVNVHTLNNPHVQCGACWGAPNPSANNSSLATRNNKWPSFVAYRFYIEDLTVSGRTWADVDAIDYALYQKHVVNPGGRYYADTYTAVTTVP